MPRQSTVIKVIKQKAVRNQQLPKPKKMGRPKTRVGPYTRMVLQYPVSMGSFLDSKTNRWDWILGAMAHQRQLTGSAPVPLPAQPTTQEGKRPMGRPRVRTEPYTAMSFAMPASWDAFFKSVKPSRQAWIVWAMQQERKREEQGQEYKAGLPDWAHQMQEERKREGQEQESEG